MFCQRTENRFRQLKQLSGIEQRIGEKYGGINERMMMALVIGLRMLRLVFTFFRVIKILVSVMN